MEKLLHSASINIVKNRLKVSSAVTNARAFIKIQDEFGKLDNYIWDFVEGRRTKHNFFKRIADKFLQRLQNQVI